MLTAPFQAITHIVVRKGPHKVEKKKYPLVLAVFILTNTITFVLKMIMADNKSIFSVILIVIISDIIAYIIKKYFIWRG